jgi:[acyl-carrier-protein] S-malonyltransferase
MGLRAAPLTVAGAFHSPLMQPAADRMAEVLARAAFQRPNIPVWSNVTSQPHHEADLELLRRRLVEQIVKPVRWSHGCAAMIATIASLASRGPIEYHELAPGSILKGLMRRIDRNARVNSHDEP